MQIQKNNNVSNEALLTPLEVSNTLKVSKSTVWRLAKTDSFPKPIKVISSPRWRHAEILQWVENQPTYTDDGEVA